MSEPTPRDVAHRESQAWLDAPKRSSVAQRVHGERAAIARVLNIRLDGVLAHDRPASANRRWLCETIRAWAPLEVIFPTCDYTGVPGGRSMKAGEGGREPVDTAAVRVDAGHDGGRGTFAVEPVTVALHDGSLGREVTVSPGRR